MIGNYCFNRRGLTNVVDSDKGHIQLFVIFCVRVIFLKLSRGVVSFDMFSFGAFALPTSHGNRCLPYRFVVARTSRQRFRCEAACGSDSQQGCLQSEPTREAPADSTWYAFIFPLSLVIVGSAGCNQPGTLLALPAVGPVVFTVMPSAEACSYLGFQNSSSAVPHVCSVPSRCHIHDYDKHRVYSHSL